ncbi:MAG: hypothetical protein KF685_04990 [Acidobacteria bacterium]|nr:hypothetical protein [Acidobacteriota bacterium]
MVCSHLAGLEQELIRSGASETYRGQAWSDNCREWVYFDLVLDVVSIAERFGFEDPVAVHENNDPKSGQERGFICRLCHDGIMGRLEGAKPFK